MRCDRLCFRSQPRSRISVHAPETFISSTEDEDAMVWLVMHTALLPNKCVLPGVQRRPTCLKLPG
jgi:hypothetical protein